MARFDARRVNLSEWAGLAAAAVVLAALAAPWFDPNAWERDVLERRGFDPDPDPTGWDVGLLTRLGALLLLVAALLVLLPHLGLRIPWRSAIWIVAALAAVLLVSLSRYHYGGPSGGIERLSENRLARKAPAEVSHKGPGRGPVWTTSQVTNAVRPRVPYR
jgi:hypothetical protein